MTRIARQSTRRLFAMPLLLAIASLIGLLLGLTGDGWRDGLSWLLLTLPILAVAIAWRRRIYPIETCSTGVSQ